MPFDNEGKIGIETILLHESGEWIKGNIAVKMSQDTNPQNAGSILTYLRRYSLQGAVGISPEDDDGNSGAGKVVGAPPKVSTENLDQKILATFASVKSMDDLTKAWNAVPVGIRSQYAQAKDEAKARVMKAAA